jgi:Taurine catabolism dioxygenase TauD, TfdA family
MPLDVQPVAVAGQQSIESGVFPLVLECSASNPTRSAAVEWAGDNRDELQRLNSKHGAVLLRGFPLSSPEDFDSFVATFGLPNFPYYESLSNAVRVNWTERVFSANEAPPEVTIYLHHEMAQTPFFPAQLFFFCQQAAEEGGQTPICRSDVLLEQLAELCPQFVLDCEEKGLQYTNVMPSENDLTSGMGRSWQSTLRAKSREEAEHRLQTINYSWDWLPDASLRATTPVLPAVRTVSSGRKVFFNQLIAAFSGWKDSRNDPAKAIRFGDGMPLDRDAVSTALALAEELTFNIPWQRGDVAFLDNFLTMHGRRTFRGTRKVLASLASPQTHAAMH